MTTMPPEMSTAVTANSMKMSNLKKPISNDTHAMQYSAARSRFMITDILAGSEAAEAVALRNKCNTNDTVKSLINNNNNNSKSNPTTIQQYLSQQNQDLLRQQPQHRHFGSAQAAPFRYQEASYTPHANHFFGGYRQHGQAQQQHTSLATRDLLTQLHVPTTHSDSGDAGAKDYEISQNEASQSPQPPAQADARYNAAADHGKVTGTEGALGGGDQSIQFDDSDSDTCGGKDEDDSSCKSDGLMGLSKKQRKARTAFTDQQLQTLEKSFERQKYLSVQDRMELANKLELSDCQVKTWYQNRRTKWKRQTAVGLELLAEAGNYAAFQRLYGNQPFLPAWPYAAAHGTAVNGIDLYYRQAAAAAVLQKPVSYRMYPSLLPMNNLSTLPLTPSALTHHNAPSTFSTLSGYYNTAGIVPRPQSSGSNSFSQAHGSNQALNSEQEMDRRSAYIATISQQNVDNAPEQREQEEENSNHNYDTDDDAAIEV